MCGIVGVIGPLNSATIAKKIAYKQQGRGQDAAGAATLDYFGTVHVEKQEGLVEEVLTKRSLKGLPGIVAVAHNRYKTVGGEGTINAQPFEARTHNKRYTLLVSENGTIQNDAILKRQLRAKGYYFESQNDAEVIANTLSYFLDKEEETPTEEALENAGFQKILIEQQGLVSPKIIAEFFPRSLQFFVRKSVQLLHGIRLIRSAILASDLFFIAYKK